MVYTVYFDNDSDGTTLKCTDCNLTILTSLLIDFGGHYFNHFQMISEGSPQGRICVIYFSTCCQFCPLDLLKVDELQEFDPENFAGK